MLEPSRQLAAHERFEHVHARVAGIEARQRGELLSAGSVELLATADGELLERFEAVRGEAGCRHREALGAAPGLVDEGAAVGLITNAGLTVTSTNSDCSAWSNSGVRSTPVP